MVENEESGRLLMIPGPTSVAPQVREAAARQVDSFTSAEFVEVLLRVLDRLRILIQHEGPVIVLPGSGTLAMEAAMVNTAASGDRVLVLSHGKWGDRFAFIAERYGIEADVLSNSLGEPVSPEQLRSHLRRGPRYQVVFATHVETSTGVRASLPELARVVREESDSLFVVDAVGSTGALEERMDEWGIDVLLTASQKGLAAPPGLAIQAIGERALEARKRRTAVPAFYCDWLDSLRVLDHPMERTHVTHSVSLIYALDESLRLIFEEGLANRYVRHQECARAVRAGLADLGFHLLTAAQAAAPTVTVALYPDGVEDRSFRAELKRQGVVVAPCVYGESVGKGIRVGHMGNVTLAHIGRMLESIACVLSGSRDGRD